jgi:ketosteroid isomerase-like protein
MKTAFFIICLSAMISSCTRPPVTPAFDLEAVKNIIKDNNKLYRIALISGDSAVFADLHHPATINMPPDAPLMTGRAAMGAMIKKMPAMGVTDYIVESTNIYGGPEDVIEEGKYEVDGQGKVMEKGKYIVIWKQDHSKWKIFRTIWNKDAK